MVVDVSVTRIREDFEKIFLANVQTVTLIRESEPDAGNYGYIGVQSGREEREIQLNIQGISSGSYNRERYGIEGARSILHAYARYSEDIQNNDIIIVNGIEYFIINLNKSFKDGQVAFQEFDLASKNPR